MRTQYAGPASHWPAPDIDAGIAWTEWTTVPPPSAPPSTWLAANAGRTQLAEDIQKPDVVALGQMLFFDAHLSRKGQVSCASCHQPQRAFTDGRPLAVGEDRLMGRRRSTPLFAAPFAPRLFWDGRAESLKAQVLGPVQDSREMNHDLTDAIARLRNLPPYPAQFLKAFGPGDVGKDEAVDAVAVDGAAVDGVAVDGVAVDTAAVDTDRLARALAAFVATIRPQATRFDAFLNGHHNVLNDRELLGLHLFRTQARCMNCHNGPLLTDHQFHNVGLSFYGRRNQDLGRFEVTRDLADLGTFRTPSLRNVSQAGPWMHNGLFTDLKGLLRMYNAGMGRDAAQAAPPDAYAPRKSEHIRPLALSADDIDALLAFLNVL
ncbi:cytochrome-c peroxidase [Achromobacter kerstersii]|uniref:cytochrome-c peroxidase n=1 Tax=Achromobacter kerstersii TaxID=1353890 RepID=UPI001FE1310A|nr:cytochrome c peroxidase [Achromobacter kerstersii]